VSLGDSPFDPRSGARPAILAGRESVLDAASAQREALVTGLPGQPLVITGRMGSGRSVMGDELARAAKRAGWAPAVITITRTNTLVHEIARGVAAMLLRRLAVDDSDRNAGPLLATTRSFAAAYGLDLPLDLDSSASRSWSGDLAEDVTYLFRLLGGAGASAGSGYMLVIDDIDAGTSTGASECLAAATDIARAGMPLLVAFSGLPGTAALLGSRLVETPLTPFGPAELTQAVAEPAQRLGAEFPVQSIVSIGRRTGGHPQFVQAMAQAAWEVATESVITPHDVEVGSVVAEQRMKADLFDPVLATLTQADRRFLKAMADVGTRPTLEMMSRRLGDASHFDPQSSELVGIRDTLLDRRVIYELTGGALDFSMPMFDRYIGLPR
jgi:hypothetical protein